MTGFSCTRSRAAFAFVFGLIMSALPETASALDLQEALRRALGADPRLSAARIEVEAAAAATYQAGRKPNPELSAELEDFFGTGELRGLSKAVLTVSVQQKFETGGKLDARVAAARGKGEVAEAEIAIAMREIIAQTKIDYVHVLGALRRAEQVSRAEKMFDDLIPLFRRRVEAGASPPADVARGELAANKAKALADKARAEIIGAKRLLVSNWAGSTSDVAVVKGQLRHNGHQLASLSSVMTAIDENPTIRLWAAVLAQREGELRVQQAAAKRDYTLSVGAKYFAETDDLAFRIGGSIPIQRYDRNEGAIREAELRLSKTGPERDTAIRTLKRRITEAYTEAEANCSEARKVAELVTPVARRASDNVRTSFDQGRLGVKDLLDAHRELFDAEIAQIDADVRCHSSAAKVETLAARKSFSAGWDVTTTRYQP